MAIRYKNFVVEVDTQPSAEALVHFETKLANETDCWDVHASEALEDRGFVLLDVRSAEAYERGHLPGAQNLPVARLTDRGLAGYPAETLFVTYCAGPHCNASTKAAVRLARLGRPVKEMIGGALGWVDEGFSLVTD